MRLTPSLNRWGKVSWLCCVQFPSCWPCQDATSTFVAPLLLVTQQHLQKRLSFPTGSIKPWFLTEGKLAVVLIIPSSWGSQRIAIGEHQATFLAPLRGEEALLRGEFLTLNLFTFLSLCLFYFLFAFLYRKYKKISYSFYSCYFIYLLCHIKNQKNLVVVFIMVA